MHYCFVSVIVITSMILPRSQSHKPVRHTGGGKNGEVFNLLLGLYKLNPLKESQVYQSYYDQAFAGYNEKKKMATKFESNESSKKQVRSHLNEIEKMIHVKTKKPRLFQKPEYDIEDVDIENFTVDILLNDRVISNEKLKIPSNHLQNDNIDNISSILEHIGSNDIDDDTPITKLLPINDVVVKKPNLKMTYEYVAKNKNAADKIHSFLDLGNKIQDKIVMSNRFDTADVIVL